MSILYAGPFVGEFGWELMRWQAKIRHMAGGYDATIVATRPSRFHLYEDFATRFEAVDVPQVTLDCYNATGFDLPMPSLYGVDDWVIPHNKHMARLEAAASEWVTYGKQDPGSEMSDAVLVHARDLTHGSPYQSDRNWCRHKWDLFVDYLIDKGHEVGAIGTTTDAMCPDKCTDLRGLDLDVLCTIMRNSLAVCGPSSGPMHLASLCQAPHLVWSCNIPRKGGENRKRYEEDWNPHGTRVKVVEADTWQVPVYDVIDGFVELVGSGGAT